MWYSVMSSTEQTEDTWGPELETLFDKLGLNERKDWMTEEEVIAAKKLVQKYNMIFSKNDLDLGKTDKVKYKIKLTDPIPFM